MRFAFELSNYDDVTPNAVGIHARLSAGSMPCDDAWTSDNIALFRQWWTKVLHPEPCRRRVDALRATALRGQYAPVSRAAWSGARMQRPLVTRNCFWLTERSCVFGFLFEVTRDPDIRKGNWRGKRCMDSSVGCGLRTGDFLGLPQHGSSRIGHQLKWPS